MENTTICKFANLKPAADVIHTTNFVYETTPPVSTSFKSDAVYRIHYVMSGKGVLHTVHQKYLLEEGDIFFTFPTSRYIIESTDNLKYMFISYIGLRGNVLMEQISITKTNPHFKHYPEAKPIWNYFFTLADKTNLDMIAESTLLYTLSLLSKKPLIDENTDMHNDMLLIKNYIDEHYQDPSLSLETISNHFSYNKKYASAKFKNIFQISIPQYITSARISNACALMENNVICVKEVAHLCGYSDTLYFSKVFKKHMRISPKEFIQQHKK